MSGADALGGPDAVGGHGGTGGEPRHGTWARAGGLVGVVADAGGGEVAVFDPASRQVARVPAGELQALPAGAVTVTVTVEMPLAHGVAEADLRRWLAVLLDDVLRERAGEALDAAGLDRGAVLPPVRLDVRAAQTGGAVCLCGVRTPAPPGTAVACAACGRQAVSAPPRADGDVLGVGSG